MKIYALIITYFLYSISWISVSGSESPTVEVQPGQEVTLLCPNISKHPTTTEWFRLVNRTNPCCISSMYESNSAASYCDGFQHRFEMSSNISTVFLKIKRVNLSDSGLYYCGFYIEKHTVTAKATYLTIQGKSESEFRTKEEPDGTTNVMTVMMGALTVVLIAVIIYLAFKIRKFQTAVTEEPQSKRNKNLGSDDLNYAALSFQSRAIRNHRPSSETNVVYATTR